MSGHSSMGAYKKEVVMNPKDLARKIDHTLLKAEATEAAVRKLCAEAVEHGFYSVCINPRWLPLSVELTRGSSTMAIAVVGFPLGAMASKTKALEAETAVATGAREIDMVLDLGSAKSGLWSFAEDDIRGVVKASGGKPVKVILETCYLSDDEIRRACAISKEAGAAFVKTSTGFGTGGATPQHIRLMRECVGPQMGVKASGGIRDFATAKALIEAGANRLGCSASVAIVQGAGGGSHGY